MGVVWILYTRSWPKSVPAAKYPSSVPVLLTASNLNPEVVFPSFVTVQVISVSAAFWTRGFWTRGFPVSLLTIFSLVNVLFWTRGFWTRGLTRPEFWTRGFWTRGFSAPG